jgi:lysophospholipase L1-like esterase
MYAPRAIAAAIACLAIGATACTSTRSSASELDAPLPTIGLGFEFEVEPGPIRGAADVRAVDAEEIDTIVMIGDSLTVGSTPALEQRFGELGFANVLIQAETGKRMTMSDGDNSSGRAITEFLVGAGDGDGSDELWVLALGTNDINQYGDVQELAIEADELLAEVPDDAAVVWVDTYYRQQPDGAADVNRVIAERVEARGNAVVAPWSAYAPNDGVVSGDGLHPTPSGREVFADVVAATVATFLEG